MKEVFIPSLPVLIFITAIFPIAQLRSEIYPNTIGNDIVIRVRYN